MAAREDSVAVSDFSDSNASPNVFSCYWRSGRYEVEDNRKRQRGIARTMVCPSLSSVSTLLVISRTSRVLGKRRRKSFIPENFFSDQSKDEMNFTSTGMNLSAPPTMKSTSLSLSAKYPTAGLFLLSSISTAFSARAPRSAGPVRMVLMPVSHK